jgi:hypothetical protein
MLPTDWFFIEEVQDFEASLQEACLDSTNARLFSWYTHLGVCPECYETEIRPPLVSSSLI